MKSAKLNVIAFNDDVIATSGLPLNFVLSGFGNGTHKDATMSVSGKTPFTPGDIGGDISYKDAAKAINALINYTGTNDTAGIWDGQYEMSLLNVLAMDTVDYSSEQVAAYNGTYKWDSVNNYYVKSTN